MKKTLSLAAFAVIFLATNICVAQTDPRGAKREKEECETLALQAGVNPRASGSGISNHEAIAFNIAKLQARSELAAQVAAEITSVIQHSVEQYIQTAGAGTDFGVERDDYQGHVTNAGNTSRTVSGILQKDSLQIVQRVSQILTNTRPICSNTYNLPDGTVQVYVCIEMDLQAQRRAYAELKQDGMLDVDVNADGKNDVDFNEKEFLLELARAREEYNAEKAKE